MSISLASTWPAGSGRSAAMAPACCLDAATALLSLGRREEAGQLLAEAFELDLESPADRIIPLIARGNLRLWDGDLAAAQTDFRQVLAELPTPLDPLGAARCCGTWRKPPCGTAACPTGVAAVADGLAVLAGAELPYSTIQLCRTGLAVEAAAAGPDRGRTLQWRVPGHPRAGGWLARPDPLGELGAGRGAHAGAGRQACSRPKPSGPGLTAHSDPERWAGSAGGMGGARPPLAGGVRPLAAGRGATGRAGAARHRPRCPRPGLDPGQHAWCRPAGYRDPGAGPPRADRASSAWAAAGPGRGGAG